MRLRVTIERQGLRPECLLWSTSSLSATSNPPPSSCSLPMSTAFPTTSSVGDLTFAQLLDQINGVIPLECGDWGLEDYVAEVAGFECLHFAKVADLLKDDDAITIRPLQTQEVRLRALGGRVQVSRDGRHLYDGVGWGRPFIRRAPRPDVRILPRRNSMAFVRGHDGLDEEEEEDEIDQAEQMLALPNPYQHGVSQYGLHPAHEPEVVYDNVPAPQPGVHRQSSLRPAKRRLESPFQPVVGVKRARSDQYSPRHTNPGRNASLSNKSVHFDQNHEELPLGEADTPATIYDLPHDLSSDDDDDFSPDTDEESEFDEADKENHDPVPSPDNRRPASATSVHHEDSDLINKIGATGANRRDALAEVETSSVTPSESDEDEHSPSAPVADENVPVSLSRGNYHDLGDDSSDDSSDDSDSEDASNSSDLTSSEDETESDSDALSSGPETSDTSKISSDVAERESVPAAQNKHPGTSAIIQGTRAPPGQGSNTTKNRNKRKRLSSKLALLKSQGQLPASATFSDLHAYIHGKAATPSNEDEFHTRRKQLLQAIEDGGVDVTEQVSQPITTELETPASAVPTAPVANESVQKTTTQESAKRRRLDKSASERLLMNGLGLRVPKSKSEADKLRQESRSASQTEINRHQRREQAPKNEGGQLHTEAVSAPIDEAWQEHVTLTAVECMDPSISYTSPPFPFEQRWDPQQASELWRQHRGKRQKKDRQRRQYDNQIEEHYDATMYDDPDINHQANMDAGDADQSERPNDTKLALPLISGLADLTQADAQIGAKVAFKTLDLSEETNWMPTMSDYKVAEITANDQDRLILRLDEAYRPSKPIDPETGERIFSNFRIEAMELDEDDSMIELSYNDLGSPKLVEPSPILAPMPAEVANDVGVEGPALQRSADDTDASQPQASFSGPETAAEISFGASTYTLVGDGMTPTPPSRQGNAVIDADARREASLLIHEAGFRSSVDPEARQPLSNVRSAVTEASQNLDTHAEGDETEFDGFSSSQAGGQSKIYEGDAQQAPTVGVFDESEVASTDPISTQRTHDSQQNPASAEASRKASPDSTFLTPAIPATTSNVVSSPSPAPDAADNGIGDIRRMMMSGALPLGETPDPASTPPAASTVPKNGDSDSNRGVEDADNGEVDSQDSLMSLDSLLASSQRLRQTNLKLQQKSTPVSQPTVNGSNTRAQTRRASAMANAATLSDDERIDTERMKELSPAPFPSTAPASFKPVNVVDKLDRKARHLGEDEKFPPPGEQKTADHAIDLTTLSDGESNDSSDDDFVNDLRNRSQVLKGKGRGKGKSKSKSKADASRAIPRTRSEI